ncbi:MAG: ferredoxin [Ruminococcus sp.]|nr:ferredoxin [Ruminococcus sp.]
MKKIKINEKCNQCGVCIVKCPAYFTEDSAGNVKVVSSSVNETAELLSAVRSCPEKAIELGAEVNVKTTIQEYISKLESLKSGITVTRNDIAFNEAYTRNVYVPSAGVSGYSYRSSSQAERAGYDAFVSRCYSQVDNLILERITDYRVTEIKPYYTTDSTSVYSKNNQKIADVLKAVSVLVSSGKLSSDFCSFDIYPDTNDIVWKMLNRGEIIGDNFIGIVKREFSYSASEYKTYIDWDDMEDYRGKSIYNYNASDASRELGNDLGNALRYAKSDIEDGALSYIKGLVDSYNRNLKTCLEKKIAEIKKLV